MKKLFLTSCCFLATVVFCANAYTQSLPLCCALEMAGVDKSVKCGDGITIGGGVCTVSTCDVPGYSQPCFTAWSWSPTTYMVPGTENSMSPVIIRCNDCVNTGDETITYTLTLSDPFFGNCDVNYDYVKVTFISGGCPYKIGGGSFEGREQNNNNIQVFSDEGTITINFKEAAPDSKVEIYNLSGSLVKQLSASGKTRMEVGMSELAKGMYVIRIVQNEKQVISKHVNME